MLSLVLLSAGCQPKLTPKETYTRISEQTLTHKNMNVTFEGEMSMAFEGDIDPSAQPFLEMFKSIKLKGDMQTRDTDRLADLAMHYDLDLNGLGMKLEMYYDGDKAIIKYPVMPDYLVLDMEKAMDLVNQEADLPMELDYTSIIADLETLSKTFLPKYMAKYNGTINEKDVSLIEDYTYTINGKTVKSCALKMTLSPESIIGTYDALYAQVAESKELYDIIKKYDTENQLGTFEAYQKAIADNKTEVFATLDIDTLKESMKGMTYEYIMCFDKKYNLTAANITMNMDTTDPTTGYKVKMDLKLLSKADYSDKAIVFPALTDDNQTDLLEMINSMGAGY